MRLFELIQQPLIESVTPVSLARDGLTIEQATLIADYIKTNCRKWLDETNNGQYVFYRGMQENYSKYLAFIKRVRTDREPKDSLPIGHDAYNAMIEAVGGVANRTNSIFVTSVYGKARQYGVPGGQVSVAFPIGDYSYTWSTAWDDWNIETTEQLESMIGQYMYHMTDIRAEAEYWWEEEINKLEDKAVNAKTENEREQIEKELDYLQTQHGKDAFIEEHIEEEDESIYEMFTDANNYKKEALSKILMVDRGLTQAAKTNHEVMINCDNVLYIEHGFYAVVRAILNNEEPDLVRFSKVPVPGYPKVPTK